MSKAKFKRELTKKLAEIGYEKYPAISDLYFVKSIGDGFYNILFITFHRYDKGAFTGDFFLSLYPSFLYEELWKKRRSYRVRVARNLDLDERKSLLNPQYNNIDISGADGWWYLHDEAAVNHFVKAVSCAEPRFISRPNLHQEVLNNVCLRWHYINKIRKVIELAYSSNIEGRKYQCVPKTDPDNMGEKWFKAAELFILEYDKMGVSLIPRAVKNIASLSYMVDKYEKLYGAYNPILLDLNCEKFSDLLSL